MVESGSGEVVDNQPTQWALSDMQCSDSGYESSAGGMDFLVIS